MSLTRCSQRFETTDACHVAFHFLQFRGHGLVQPLPQLRRGCAEELLLHQESPHCKAATRQASRQYV